MDSLLSAALADVYRLERELGAGGMATVYLAEDVKHHRKVAVKVLRPELAAALGRDRFLREITTTAQLRHPNILPLFDSGERAGFLFYVMPFVEGESLRARLMRNEQLSVDEALAIADEVADALSYAHGRGVVHRDIKPENIMLENGHAVVADFGIASAVSTVGDDKLTMVGVVVGTPHYMSPEQASGELVDARADLYALGCVMYEMLAGDLPYNGPNAMAIMARHAIDPVPSIEAKRPGVGRVIASAVERALAKSPDDRFATVQEWRAALRSATPTATAPLLPPIHKPPPTTSTALLGREDSLAVAADRLSSGARVLTVSGYGGTGKTRVAIELFRRLHGAYPGGAAFVSLASVTVPSEVLPTVATALDIAEAHGRSALDAIATVIGERRVLLVLDNMEQVLAAAEDVAALVSRCAGLCVIVTSRAPLKIGAESEFTLPPLELPAASDTSVEALMKCPSVALFVQRAQKVQPSFALTQANAPSVAAICRQLDGLPLALELAAARIRILEPSALLQRLDHALDLLTSGDRDLPLRQRTLRAAISWSYSLLDASEQRLLRRLSVFHEGWTLEAMEQVCYDDTERARALDELDSLVEKGLARVVGAAERYALLETIRAFAAEQLHADGDVSGMRASHAEYFVRFAKDVDAGIKDERQVDAVRRARVENANTQAAIQWYTARALDGDDNAVEQGLLLCGYLNWPWHIVGQHMTARTQVDFFLARVADGGPTLGRALSLWTSNMVCSVTGDVERGTRDAAQAVADARVLGNPTVLAELQLGCGYIYLMSGRVPEAREILEEAIATASKCGAPFVEGLAQSMLGLLRFMTGDLDAGLALVRSARRTQERLHDCEGGGIALSFLAQMTFAKGDHAGALVAYRQALELFETVGDRPEIARVHSEIGWTALAAGDGAEARRAFARALKMYEEVGSPRGTGLALVGLAAVEAAAGAGERAVAIVTAANELTKRAGVVVAHPMDPGVMGRIESLKATIPQGALAGLEANARALSPADVLAMVM